jgi:CRP-like cAMP-binding protein
MDQFQQLEKFISAVAPLDEVVLKQFIDRWTACSAKRKTILTRAGETERYLYFVIEGIQRVYYFDEQGREATIVFSYPPSFGGVADSFLTQAPSRFFAETLTPSIFLKISFPQMNYLAAELTRYQYKRSC